MHIITIYVTFLKIQLLMILKKSLLTELEKNIQKKILRKAILNIFGVGPVLGG